MKIEGAALRRSFSFSIRASFFFRILSRTVSALGMSCCDCKEFEEVGVRFVLKSRRNCTSLFLWESAVLHMLGLAPSGLWLLLQGECSKSHNCHHQLPGGHTFAQQPFLLPCLILGQLLMEHRIRDSKASLFNTLFTLMRSARGGSSAIATLIWWASVSLILRNGGLVPSIVTATVTAVPG